MPSKNILLPVLSILIFSAASAQKQKAVNYGRNVVAFSPLQVSIPGVGIGLSYERELDRKGIAALYIPVAFSFANTYGTDHYYSRNNVKYYTTYFTPGIKFYPTGSKGKVKYAIGPSLALVLGQRPIYEGYIYPYTRLSNRLSLGTMVSNSVNINPTEHLYIGIDMSVGVCYIDQTDGVSTGYLPALFQFGLKLGYRF